MNRVIYSGDPKGFSWLELMPWNVVQDLLRHRDLIFAVTLRDFRAAHQASYLGLAWQFILPLIMLAIFYLVFGQIFGGRFSTNTTETPIEFALALFVGLGFYNIMAQSIGSATGLITSNATYVKTLSFPLEVLSVTAVLNSLLNLVIGLTLVTAILLVIRGGVHGAAVLVPFYVLCIFLMALGVSWGLSALAVFIRDVSAVTMPLTLILMFMCPIFYPMSMVPKKIKWVIEMNPVAVVIEEVRGCLLYGVWPSITSMVTILFVALLVAVAGHFFFMRSKPAFADVM